MEVSKRQLSLRKSVIKMISFVKGQVLIYLSYIFNAKLNFYTIFIILRFVDLGLLPLQ
jgi:hypothetical protein